MMRKAFAQKGFRRLFLGMSASMFGDSVMLLVLSMWVKSLTHSNGAAGLTFFWMVIPALFAPAYGMFVDRVRRKPLLVWGNLVSALMVLPLLLVHHASQVWIIYVVAFLYGLSFGILPAGLNGLLVELLPQDQLVGANSSMQTVKESFRLIGPLIGAGLFGTLGGGSVAIVDAATFVIAAVAIAGIPVREDAPVREQQHVLREMTGGIRHLAGDPIMRHVLVALGLVLLVIGFTESSIYAILDAFDKPVTFASVIVAVQGVGAISGGLSSGPVIRRVGEVGGFWIGVVLLAISMGLVAGTSTLWVLFVAIVPFGFALPLVIVAFTTLIQRRTPAPLMGRVSAATDVVLGTPQSISLALGAALVVVFSYHLIWAVMAVVTALAAGYLLVVLRRSVFAQVAGVADASGPDAPEAAPAAPSVVQTGAPGAEFD